MNIFLNYVDGELTINTYRFPNTTVTTLSDFINCVENGVNEALCASVENLKCLRNFILMEKR